MVFPFKNTKPVPESRPQLELSGPVLTDSFEGMLHACEEAGGVERYVDALKLKSTIFKKTFSKENFPSLTPDTFARLASLMPTVRRRIGPYLEDEKYPALHKALACLFTDDTPDVRLAGLMAAFPIDKHHRWVRDMGAEVLHHTYPETIPLMCRWVWDRKANAGVIREIWYGDADHITIQIDDDYETFLMLREELSQFLTTNGVFQDVIAYVDLLCAQIYGEYVAAQGGSYLKADFSAAEDPAKHMKRLLGLDGVRAKTDRNIPASINGTAEQVNPATLLTGDHS